jgi:hypothetical protein
MNTRNLPLLLNIMTEFYKFNTIDGMVLLPTWEEGEGLITGHKKQS